MSKIEEALKKTKEKENKIQSSISAEGDKVTPKKLWAKMLT